MSQEAMEVVFDHLHARRRGDVEAVAATLDPEVVHEGVRPDLLCSGRDEVLANVRRSIEAGSFGVDRLELVDAGEDVVLGLAGPRFQDAEDGPAEMRSPEASATGEVFIVFTVRDRRIIRMRDFRSRDTALAAAAVAR